MTHGSEAAAATPPASGPHPRGALGDPWVWCIGILLAAWGAMVLTWPTSGDAQVFLWLADLAAHGGGVPYRDAFETKGPMAWFPLVPVVALAGGAKAWTVRAVDVAMCAAGAWGCWRVAGRAAGRDAARLAALLHVAWWTGLDFWNSAQPDAWVGGWIAVAIALAGPTAGLASLLAAGTLVGFAAMVKPFYVGFALVPAMGTWRASGRAARSWALATGVALGLALPALAIVRLGAWRAWLDCLGWTARIYTDGDGLYLTRVASTLMDALQAPWGLLTAFAVAGLASAWWRGARSWALAGAIWIGGAIAVVFVQGKGWPYHWLPLLPALAVHGAVALVRLREAGAAEARYMGRALSAVALGAAMLPSGQQLFRWVRSLRSDVTRASYDAREFRSYGRQPGAVVQLVDSLIRGTPPTDRVLVWGFYPGVGPLLGRAAGSKYAIMRPLYDGAGSDINDSLRTDFVVRLTASPPRWWLVATDSMMDRRQELDAWRVEHFPAAAAILKSRYQVTSRGRDWVVHERVSQGTLEGR